MTTYRVHLIYKDVFEEEADSLGEAIRRVKDCFAEAHDPLLLGNEPEIFGYEYAGDASVSSRLSRGLDKIEKTEVSIPLSDAIKRCT